MTRAPVEVTGASVSLAGVSRTYAIGDGNIVRAADDVTLEIEPGDFVGLMGPSGSGKSTLLHLIGAIDAPDTGTVSVDGVTITRLNARALADYRSGIGFVFQGFHLIGSLSLLDNVCVPLVGRPQAGDRRARGREVLDAVGLGARALSLPGRLSGGQQQRAAIARALIVNPRLLLADEPTGNLDSSTAEEILDLVGSIRRRFGTTVIMATHDPDVARRCHRVIHLRDGRILPSVTET